MGSNMWCIFASLLLVSAGASRYDQGPQKFYDVSSDFETSEQNDNREVILYLTPDQVSALEAGGAVVRPAEAPQNDETDSELLAEKQVNEDQEEASEQDENEEDQPEEEAQDEEQETPEDIQNQDLDFEEILRILNEEQVEEEQAEEAAEEQALNEPQVREENTESPRNFSPRFTLRQQQQQLQEERYLAPGVAKKEQVLKSYSYIRYQPNDQRQKIIQLLQQQQEEVEPEESSEEPQTEGPIKDKKKYKLIPYEVIEAPAPEVTAEEPTQQNSEAEDDAQRLSDLITPLLSADRLTKANGERKNKQNELRLQSILRDLKASPKYNDQKYAIEIERLRANLEKQNAASKAEGITKVVPGLIKQQLNKKRRLNKSKQGKGATRDAETQQTKPQQPKSQKSSAPLANARTISVPVIKAEKTDSQKPISIPVETNKRVSVKNVYVRTRTDKPYIISRRVPENKRQNPVEVPTSKPERITILRHIWEH